MSEVRKGADLDLSRRVQDGLRVRLNEAMAINPAMAAILRNIQTTDKRMRQELLRLDNERDMQRWQELHNDKERYQVISDKPSHQKDDHRTAIIYYELGTDLPLTKSTRELRG